MTVSVVIPTYKAEAFIGRTLASVFAQTHRPDEIIVADDASPDGTVAVVERLAAHAPVPVRVVRLPQNTGGPAKPLNVGIQAATGSVIATLDHDDEFAPEKLARSLDALATLPSAGLVFGRVNLLTDCAASQESHAKLESAVRALPQDPLGPGLRRIRFAVAYNAVAEWGCLAHTCSNMVFPRAVWQRVGGFDESLRAVCDYRFLQQVAAKFDLIHIERTLADWRLHATNLTATAGPNWVDREVARVALNFECQRLRTAVRQKLQRQAFDAGYERLCAGRHAEAARWWGQALIRTGFSPLVAGALLKLPVRWITSTWQRVRQ